MRYCVWLSFAFWLALFFPTYSIHAQAKSLMTHQICLQTKQHGKYLKVPRLGQFVLATSSDCLEWETLTIKVLAQNLCEAATRSRSARIMAGIGRLERSAPCKPTLGTLRTGNASRSTVWVHQREH